MKRLENGTLYTLEIFNRIDREESTSLRQIDFQSTLLGLMNKFIKNNNPEAQELMLEDVKKEENINTFVQMYFQQIMNEMRNWTTTLSKVDSLFDCTFNTYLKHFYTKEQLKTIEVDNTKELFSIKNIGFYVLNTIFANKESAFHREYFVKEDHSRYGKDKPVTYEKLGFIESKTNIFGEGQKYKYIYSEGLLNIDKLERKYELIIRKKDENIYEFSFTVRGFNKRFNINLEMNKKTNEVESRINKGRGDNVKKYHYVSRETISNTTDLFLKEAIFSNSDVNKKMINNSNIF